MSGSNRDKLPKIGGLILAALAIVAAYFTISDLSAGDRAYINNAAHESQNYAEQSQDRIRDTCGPVASVGHQDCVAKEQATAREYERNEYDLAAQMTMAWWTKVMGAAAVLGVLLSAVGVYLIWQTWGETRKAAGISESTYNAFVAIESGRIDVQIKSSRGWTDCPEPPAEHEIEVLAHRVGKHDAKIIRFGVGILPSHEYRKDLFDISDCDLVIGGSQSNGKTLKKLKIKPIIPTYIGGYVTFIDPLDTKTIFFCYQFSVETQNWSYLSGGVMPNKFQHDIHFSPVERKGWPADT